MLLPRHTSTVREWNRSVFGGPNSTTSFDLLESFKRFPGMGSLFKVIVETATLSHLWRWVNAIKVGVSVTPASSEQAMSHYSHTKNAPAT